MNSLTIVLLLVSITLTSCHGTKINDQNPDLQAQADKILGSDNIIELNGEETFALCKQKPHAEHARRQYRYLVIRMRDRKVVQEGIYSMGYVKWLDNESIEVFSGSPSPAKDGGAKKIIHVNSPVE